MIKKEKIETEDGFSILSYSPIKFYELFVNEHPPFKDGQQDYIEFIGVLLNDISMENNKNKLVFDYKELNLESKERNIMNII